MMEKQINVGLIDHTIETVASERSFQLMEEPELEVFTLEAGMLEGEPDPLVGSCLAAGTRITMADGSNKAVEDIQQGDMVLTFDHEGCHGTKQEVYLVYKSPCAKQSFTMHFDKGGSLTIVGIHDLFERESMQYVRISDEKAESFIGKHFYSVSDGRFAELLSISRGDSPVDYCSVYTKNNANCIAEGMLTAPDDSDEMLNIFSFNEDLSVNREVLDADIAKYGLYEYPSDADYSKEVFDYLGWKYIHLMIGKGFGTWDDFCTRRDEFLTKFQ